MKMLKIEPELAPLESGRETSRVVLINLGISKRDVLLWKSITYRKSRDCGG